MKELPKIKIGRKIYIVDERLRQVRNARDIREFYDFESDADLEMFLLVAYHGIGKLKNFFLSRRA